MRELQSNYGRLSKGEAALIYAIVNEEEISVGRALSRQWAQLLLHPLRMVLMKG